MRTPTGTIIFIAAMLLLDWYMFQAIKTVTHSASPRTRTIIMAVYWGIAAFAIIGFLVFVLTNADFMPHKVRTYLFATIMGLFIAKLVGAVFFLVDDIRRGIQWVAARLFLQDAASGGMAQEPIGRSAFISWLGLITGGGLFGSLVYGFGNKYKYQVTQVPLAFDNVPAAFKGLKIVHISDIHSGSFTDKAAVQKGVQLIMNQQPDLILFTGDLVNNLATEMDNYMDVFNQLKAPLGVFSTLGNHDYADYVRWESAAAKQTNLEQLKQVHAKLGWRLLLDENVRLQKADDVITLVGVQNISGRRSFHSYGDLNKACTGVVPEHFTILMSHDPSHWDSEVKKNYPNIDLMLSGHTHGMQFGLEVPGFKWSPVQYIYKQWAGLYEAEKQKLYINRGFGFIGYPGRIGIMPEITVLQLV